MAQIQSNQWKTTHNVHSRNFATLPANRSVYPLVFAIPTIPGRPSLPLLSIHSVPLQKNGYDCALFVCWYAAAMVCLVHRTFNFEDTWFRENLVTNCKPFKFTNMDIHCFRHELRQLIQNLSRMYRPWKKDEDSRRQQERMEEKRKAEMERLAGDASDNESSNGDESSDDDESHNNSNKMEFCNQELPSGFHESQLQIGRVPAAIMAYLLTLKGQLKENDFAGLPKVKEGHRHAGKFMYLGDNQISWKRNSIFEREGVEGADILEQFAKCVAAALPLGRDGYRMDPGFVMTLHELCQNPHRDFKGHSKLELLAGEEHLVGCLSSVLHLPLCEEGMQLNIWPEDKKGEKPIRIDIPFGTFLVARVDVVHGGVFGSSGNVRLHIAYEALETAIESEIKTLMDGGHVISEELQAKYKRLGATEAGHKTRELDHLTNDCQDYYEPQSTKDHGAKINIVPPEESYTEQLLKNYPHLEKSLAPIVFSR